MWVYVCQEDMPYNSFDGYKALTADLNYPQVAAAWDDAAEMFFTTCGLFSPKPRDGFHDPVVRDIPTLSIGSGWDTQTAAS